MSNAQTGLQPQIAVDFDNTLCDFAFPAIGKIKQGAKEALTRFRELGYRILIYSCRTCHWHYDVFGGDPTMPTLERPTVKDMIKFLDENEIPYDEIDDGSRGKPMCEYMIDDKGIRYEDNWEEITRFIEGRTPVLATVEQ